MVEITPDGVLLSLEEWTDIGLDPLYWLKELPLNEVCCWRYENTERKIVFDLVISPSYRIGYYRNRDELNLVLAKLILLGVTTQMRGGAI